MEIDTVIPPPEPRPLATQADDPYVADLLKVADDKIAALTVDNDMLQQEAVGKAEKVDILKKQVRVFVVFFCEFSLHPFCLSIHPFIQPSP